MSHNPLTEPFNEKMRSIHRVVILLVYRNTFPIRV